MDPVQHLLALAKRERRNPAPARGSARPTPTIDSSGEAAWRHQRLQQAIVQALRTGRALDLDEQAELQWFARLGMTEAEALAYLLRKYSAVDAPGRDTRLPPEPLVPR